MRKQFYIDLCARLKTIIWLEDVMIIKDVPEVDDKPVIKHFDLWNNNLQALGKEGVFDMPAIFIEYMPIKWEATGTKGQQSADLVLRLHIITNTLAKSSDNSKQQSQALHHLELIDKLHYCMAQWIGTDYTGHIVRTQSLTDNNHNQILHNIEEFITKAVDDSGVYYPKTVTLKANITGEIKKI